MSIRNLFKGGLHPKEHKDYSKDKPIEVLPAPKEVCMPMVQHVGAPSKPVVAKGDKVKLGQVVGEPMGYVSVPVHASVSGKVTKVELSNHPLGKRAMAVFIENDGEDLWEEGLNQRRNFEQFSASELLEMVRQAGIAGLGGAGFPTHVKLKPPKDKPIDALVINGAECEPYLTSDDRLMVEHAEEIIGGTLILMKILTVSRGFVGIEENKPVAFEKMASAASKFPNISVRLLPVKYPQGAEKQLIQVLTGRTVPSGGLPLDVGVVCDNVGTAKAVFDAIRLARPLVERVVTVTGDGVKRPGNYLTRIGTPMRWLLEKAEFLPGDNKFITGGPMMGVAFADLDVPVIKGTTGIVAFRRAQEYTGRPCIRCGRCVRVCPILLQPYLLSVLSESGDFKKAEETALYDCYECGCCAYVCPAKRPIVHQVKLAKEWLAKEKARKA